VGIPHRDFVVGHHPVKTLPGRISQQLLGQRHVLLRGKSKLANDCPDLLFGHFNALGDFHLLLAREQRHLAHLLQIHPDRIIQDVQPGTLGKLLQPLDTLRLDLVNDLDLEPAQLCANLLQVLRYGQVRRQMLADIRVGKMPLFPAQQHKLPDAFRDLTREIIVTVVARVSAIAWNVILNGSPGEATMRSLHPGAGGSGSLVSGHSTSKIHPGTSLPSIAEYGFGSR